MRNKKIKYIILSAGHEWNYYSWLGVSHRDDIRFIKNLFSKYLDKIWWKRLFRNKLFCDIFWIPYIKRKLNILCGSTVLIVYDWGALTSSPYCVKKLKKTYPNLNIIYIYTNVVRISGSKTYGLLPELNKLYDMVFAFDPNDAKKYGFDYSKLIYTIESKPLDITESKYDIFYVGQAKDRYKTLLQIYRNAVSQGLRCLFYITGVPESEQIRTDDIIYNHPITYEKVLDLMLKSRCIVDAIQGDSAGLTIKTCEAVMLNRKIITTNSTVVQEPFYNNNNILIYTGKEDISGFMNLPFIPYSKKDQYEFSPDRLFAQIETNLKSNV